MARLGNFSMEVREALAKRAGYRCSFPGCRATTIGPSEESNASTNSSGMACHIMAAGSGGSARRVVSGTTSKQLSDISNGIWMCYRHGKMIDADEKKFSIPILKTWRDIAELKAKLRHELGHDIEFDSTKFDGFKLPVDEILIPHMGAENKLVGDALKHSCLEDIWGKEIADALRDACIELIRNAFTHGGAKNVKILIGPTSVTVEDDGCEYNSAQIYSTPTGGGGKALQVIVEGFRSKVLLFCKRANSLNQNTFSFLRKAEDISLITPCAIKLTSTTDIVEQSSVIIHEDCNVFYLILPLYLCMSDVYALKQLISKVRPKYPSKNIIFVLTTVSKGVKSLIRETFPDIGIIHFDEHPSD